MSEIRPRIGFFNGSSTAKLFFHQIKGLSLAASTLLRSHCPFLRRGVLNPQPEHLDEQRFPARDIR
jgi:hypothetical protein